MGNLTHTVSGDIASFRSAARVPIESLKCHFKPVQDLHGYDKPWPAGGGKNLITTTEYKGSFYTNQTGIDLKGNAIYTSYTQNNNTITVTTTADWYGCIFATNMLAAGDYKVHLTVDSDFRGCVLVTDDNLITTQVTQYSGSSINQTVTLSSSARIAVYIGCGSARSTTVTDLQVEAGTSYTNWEPYENICPIEGWNSCTTYKAGKNIGHVVGYSAKSTASPTSVRDANGNYGNSLSTINYVYPDTPVTITQTQWPNESSVANYRNGYFTVVIDNLMFGETYDFSFKVSNITNNPLNVSISQINITEPYGRSYKTPSEVVNGNTLIFRNVRFNPHDTVPDRSEINIYYCGMSFTLSEFMVTPANMSDGVFEPYCGDIIPITFPIAGKNKYEVTEFNSDNWTGMGYNDNYLTRLNPSIDTINKTITITTIGSGSSQFQKKTHFIPSTYTFSFDLTANTQYLDKRMIIVCFDQNDNILTNDDVSITGLTWNQYYKGFFSTPGTFTVPNTVSYFTIAIGVGNDNDDRQGIEVTFSNIQLELGSVATTYEPYSSNNTFYGGYVDIAAGEIVAEWYKYIITGNEQTWNVSNNGIWPQTYVPSGKQAFDYTSGYCSHAPYKPFTRGHIGVMYNERTLVFDPDIGDLTYWKQYCTNQYNNGTPVYIVYKLRDAIHYPLSKQELNTFLNQNNYWSNTNDITEVSYQIHDSNMIQQTKKRMLAENELHYRKVLWNQIDGPMNDDNWVPYNTSKTTVSFNNNIASCEIIDTASSGYSVSLRNKTYPTVNTNSIYYASYMINPEYTGNFGIEFAGGYQFYGTYLAEANEWTHCSFISIGKKNGSGAQYIPFPSPNSYPQNTNPKFQIKSPIYINLTQMFGAGQEPTKEEFERLCVLNHVDLTEYHPQDIGTEQVWCIPNYNRDQYITVEWNQWARSFSSDYYKIQAPSIATATFNNSEALSELIQDALATYQSDICTKSTISVNTNDVLYVKQDIKVSSANKSYGIIIGSQITSAFISESEANSWITISGRGSMKGTSKYIYFGRPNVCLVTGDTIYSKNPMVINLTQMFGAGNEPTQIEFERLCALNNIDLTVYQPYNAGTKMIWKI